MTIEQLALAGGLYVPLVFWHFVVDWLTQTEKMAESKSENPKILALHCLIYTVSFIPIVALYGLGYWEGSGALLVLCLSHIVGDSYFGGPGTSDE